VRLVENLQTDLSSGVALAHLIEIISGSQILTDINLNPKNMHDFKENIEKILRFMHTNSIRMHQTTSREIIAGDLKSIMRLVLALAAHFKPTNVQPYAKQYQIKQTSSSCLTNNNNSNSNNQTSSISNQMISKRSNSTNNMVLNGANSTYVVGKNQDLPIKLSNQSMKVF
jgi:hypothetical protein